MNPIKKIFILACLVVGTSSVWAQDTLPKFSVSNVGKNRIIIGWVNNYPLVKQISIQRSFDSLGIYKTILSVADPNAVQNGFADTKAPNDRMFYRLFILLDKGEFLFSQAKRPTVDTAKAASIEAPQTKFDSLLVKEVKADSVKTAPKPVIKKPEYVPSVYVYTNRDGYVFINLPDADQKKYRIKFFEENDAFLFELKNIHDAALTLDKANFYHSGWFKFELYNEEKLVEKNKFYIAKDF